jgi:hypothetical protein
MKSMQGELWVVLKIGLTHIRYPMYHAVYAREQSLVKGNKRIGAAVVFFIRIALIAVGRPNANTE